MNDKDSGDQIMNTNSNALTLSRQIKSHYYFCIKKMVELAQENKLEAAAKFQLKARRLFQWILWREGRL